MPEDKCFKLLQSPSRSDQKKKKTKKKRKKVPASTTPLENNTETPQAVALPPETSSVFLLPPQSPGQHQGQLPKLRETCKKDGERLTGCGRRSKKHSKVSASLLAVTNKSSESERSELSSQARESLRWEGVLEDPQAEEKRLEVYRANRRQRYISHREALLKETEYALRQTFPKESKEKNDLDVTNRSIN